MPKYWHDRHTANKIEDEADKNLCRSIVADKKPYFMRYIYPSLMRQYNEYVRNTDKNALREFRMTVEEMRSLPYSELSDRQKDFLRFFDLNMPVGIGDCVMNRICRIFEKEFDGFLSKKDPSKKFDYSFMKSGSDYSKSDYYAVKKLYDDYNRRVQNYKIFTSFERVDKASAQAEESIMKDEFIKECTKQIPNRNMLCDVLIDICYSKASSRRFAWNVCGADIVNNLLTANDFTFSYPELDNDGDIGYRGNKYSIKTVKMEVTE